MKHEVPFGAFITFVNEDGYNAALKMKYKTRAPEEGQIINEVFAENRIKFKEAPEPTNIIWENIH